MVCLDSLYCVLDKIMKEQKKTPAPNTYKFPLTSRIEGGKMDKTTGFSFMSESEFLGKSKPGPSHYKINEDPVKKRTLGFKLIKPKARPHWKPKKTNAPGPGTHDESKEPK